MNSILLTFIAILLSLFSLSSMANNGIISIPSQHSVDKTAERLVSILEAKGMKIFNQIDHAKGAKGVGVDLRDTRLVIFGNPKVGSPLMACQQTVALDLPQKALIWKDKNEKVFISYNAPDYLQARHEIEGCDVTLDKVSKALGAITSKAAN